MPRRLTLHIGSHKTGTTSIQRFMQANGAELATRGMAYVSGRNSSVSEFVGPEETGFLPQGCRLRNEIEFYALLDAAPSDHIVASSESFSYFFHPGPIEALASGLAQRVDEVRVLVYLRRQDRHVVSHHQEGAKPHAFGPARSLWGNGLGALPAPDPRHALYIDYDHRLGLWADVFGSAAIQARVFDRDSLHHGDVVQDALHALGVAPEGLAPIPDQNTSLGARQAWLGHLMNGAGASASAIGQVLRAMEGGPRSLPARAEAEAFYAPWREGNQRLNKRFGINARPDLFNDDFSDYPESATPVWDLAAAEAVLGELLRHGTLQGFSADDLRDAATSVRKTNPELALRFAKAALALRPSGKGIQSLVQSLDGSPTAKSPRGTGPNRSQG